MEILTGQPVFAAQSTNLSPENRYIVHRVSCKFASVHQLPKPYRVPISSHQSAEEHNSGKNGYKLWRINESLLQEEGMGQKSKLSGTLTDGMRIKEESPNF